MNIKQITIIGFFFAIALLALARTVDDATDTTGATDATAASAAPSATSTLTTPRRGDCDPPGPGPGKLASCEPRGGPENAPGRFAELPR